MHKILIAASLLAGLGGFAAASTAHADEFNGTAQRSMGYFHYGRNAPSVFDSAPAAPSAYALQAPTSTGFGEDAYNTKSHGHP